MEAEVTRRSGKGNGKGNGKGLSNASPRIERLRQRYFSYKPSICIERARIAYQYYSEPKNQSLPIIRQKAGAFRAVLNRLPITIYEDELVVGSLASRPRAYPMFPENFGTLFAKELDTVSTRWPDPFEISDSDRREFQEKILPFWDGRSEIERFNSLLTPIERNFIFRNPDDLTRGSGIISMNPALFGSGGHIALDFPKVLEKGFLGIKQEAVTALGRLDPLSAENIGKRGFYLAVIECCEGMTEFGLRFSQLAKEMASKETNPQRREELHHLHEVCARVPGSPARTFNEALQSLWFSYIASLQEDYNRCSPLGRVDSFLYPFYQRDMETKRLTVAQAQELLDCLWLKLGESNFINWGSFSKLAAGFPVQQQIPVGGQTREGKDAANPLTYQCIQATMNTRLHQPSLTVRLHKETPLELYRKACELSRMGMGHPSFFNDEVVVPALVKSGVSVEDARDYTPVGCVGAEVSGCGKGAHNGGYLNSASALEFTLTRGFWRNSQKQVSMETENPREFATFEQFWDAFESHLRNIMRIHIAVSLKVEYLHEQCYPTPYLSTLTRGCLEKGRDKTRGGAVYNLGMSFRTVDLGNVADSLTAIKKLVFEEKSISMGQLLDAVEKNFEGNEALRQRLITRAPHYGNDDGDADDMARKIVSVISDECSHAKSYFGGPFYPGYGSVSSHGPFGSVMGAFPDGRKAGAPLTDGIGPVHNRDHSGPTSLLKSVSKMGHVDLSGGSILNIKFPPKVVEGEKGLANFISFLKSFVQLKIWHCQFNIVNAETLRDAQRHPENYQDLLIRVAGYSSFFTILPKELQDDIIDRTEHSLSASN
jgi:pyruvate formate-lyase/glycerol dehydratase family glycyl radical enzyme